MDPKVNRVTFIVVIGILVLLFLLYNKNSGCKSQHKNVNPILIADKNNFNSNTEVKTKHKQHVKLPQIENRGQFGSLLESLKAEKMIEIGVQEGNFALEILQNWPSFKYYYGIDVWRSQDNYKDFANKDDGEQEKKYKKTVENLEKYGQKIKLYRTYSTQAKINFEEKSVDFIYVDARHDFCGVYEDLQNYYPKLKCNGVMAGHDYHTADDVMKASGQDFGLCSNGSRVLVNGGAVKGAVLQFIKEMEIGIENLFLTKENFWISYYFAKICK